MIMTINFSSSKRWLICAEKTSDLSTLTSTNDNISYPIGVDTFSIENGQVNKIWDDESKFKTNLYISQSQPRSRGR